MDLKLHANATTTPRTRGYIQNSRASNAALARELAPWRDGRAVGTSAIDPPGRIG